MTKNEMLKIAKPILFNTEMVQAILDGRKSVTRRVAKKSQPTCKKGDILYVRETFFKYKGNYHYKADGKHAALDKLVCGSFFKWQPSIHMPREAARYFLRVNRVYREKLHDMTLDDFLSEGVVLRPEAFNDPDNAYYQAKDQYAALWNSTVKKSDLDKYGWNANPWVWVIEFERV